MFSPAPSVPFVSRFFWFVIAMAIILGIITWAGNARAEACTQDNNGRTICMGTVGATHLKTLPNRHKVAISRRKGITTDASGNVVRSRSGIAVRVAPAARAALQCIVDHVEAAGVRIKAMRGYGPGTVRGSLHPSGRALDINQTDRDVTHPPVPRAVSNAAADACGVVSGARWGYADNGHWNLAVHGRATQEPWPRVLGVAQ